MKNRDGTIILLLYKFQWWLFLGSEALNTLITVSCLTESRARLWYPILK